MPEEKDSALRAGAQDDPEGVNIGSYDPYIIIEPAPVASDDGG